MDDRLISPEDDPTLDVEGHGMDLGNDNETVVDGEPEPAADVVEVESDVEGHKLASNDNETVVED